MLWGRNDDKFIVKPWVNSNFGMGLRPFHKADINLQISHCIDHIFGVSNPNLNEALRPGLHPGGNAFRQQVLANGEARGDSDMRAAFRIEERLDVCSLLK